MKMDFQVASYEQTDRLYDLGVRNPGSVLRWVVSEKKKSKERTLAIWGMRQTEVPSRVTHNHVIALPALTAAELGVALGNASAGCVYDESSPFRCWFVNWDEDLIERHETEASARAALLINLLERGEIKVEDVNNRLNPA